MRTSALIEKLSRLAEINPDANVYFCADDDGMRFIEDRYLIGDRLSDVQLTLGRWLGNGEEYISIDTEQTSRAGDNENKKSKKIRCEHETVLKIYKDDSHKEISHYRCLQCGKKESTPFGKKVVKSNREARKAAFS